MFTKLSYFSFKVNFKLIKLTIYHDSWVGNFLVWLYFYSFMPTLVFHFLKPNQQQLLNTMVTNLVFPWLAWSIVWIPYNSQTQTVKTEKNSFRTRVRHNIVSNNVPRLDVHLGNGKTNNFFNKYIQYCLS